MSRRQPQSLADYLTLAISPALIMALVGSLVFFLLEVFYRGQFEARLNFIFALFVMATVLVARISMRESIEYATLFAIPLALVTVAAIFRFVEFTGPMAGVGWLINLALIGLIWWSAHKLTWDCTLVDDSQDASGEGLLQTVGLDSRNEKGERKQEECKKTLGEGIFSFFHLPFSFLQSHHGTPAPPTDDLEDGMYSPPLTWWQRYVERRRRPHAPGVWVVYFSLASLPLFGIGQWLIPAADLAGRRQAFWLLCIYVAAGLSLLLTTSFLGLRRYLRQHRLEMPAPMTGAWLGTGAVMIVVLMVFCALLPRPSAEYPISRLPFMATSPGDTRASRYGWGEEPANDDRADTPAAGSSEQSRSERSSPGKSASRTGGKNRPNRSGSRQGKSSDGQTHDKSGQHDQRSDRNDNGSPQQRKDDSPSKSGAEGKQGPASQDEAR